MTSELPTYRFADIFAEVESFRAFKAGQTLALEPKAFAVLLLLLKQPGRLVSKEELLDAVWKD